MTAKKTAMLTSDSPEMILNWREITNQEKIKKTLNISTFWPSKSKSSKKSRVNWNCRAKAKEPLQEFIGLAT